ncbi:MAG: hypothetical protein VZS44_09235 [Bacilli bacterium]|nr:hypothetical protein [Bacilli bacterium]
MNIFDKIKSKFKKVEPPEITEDMVFTHNCGARMVCGRLEPTPSMMALGSTLGTTIDGSHKGAGITKMQGEICRVQYYFEQQKWINETYFKQRGLNELGYLDENISNVAEEIELEGTIDLDDSHTTTVIEFDDEHAEIDNRKDQKFSEV